MNDVIQFWNYITSPETAIPAIVGMVIGVGIGMFISHPCFNYLMTCRKLKREDRKEKEQKKEQAALRRLEAFKRRKAFEGLEIHQSGTYYFDSVPGRIEAMFCRQCLENRLVRVKMHPLYHDPNRVHCPGCNAVGERY